MADLRTLTGTWDELLDEHGEPRPAAAALVEQLRALGLSELRARQDAADLDILTMGITFTVYSDGQGIDRAWPLRRHPPGDRRRRVAAASRPGSSSASWP